MSITEFPDLFCLPICIQRFLSFFFLPCGQKRLNYLTRMRGGSNNRETSKGVPSSKNNRQLATCRPFRDSCMRTKPNSYRHGSYRLGSVYRQGSKTLFHAYGPRARPSGSLAENPPATRCPSASRSALICLSAHSPRGMGPITPSTVGTRMRH